MKKTAILLAIGCLLMTLLAGCGAATGTADTTVRVVGLSGSTGVGMAELMRKSDAGETDDAYHFDILTEPTQAVAAITSGKADIAAVPTNLAATLYQKTQGNVQVLALNTLGVLYMMENGDKVQSVADLRGQEIVYFGQGSNPEFILRYVLRQNGLDPDKDVSLIPVADADELASRVVSGMAKIAMVPEPKVSACTAQMKAAGKAPARVALDMTEEWNKIADGSTLVMGCIIARRDFVQSSPQITSRFLKEYEASVSFAREHTEEAAALCEQFGIIPKAAIAKMAIPRCHLVCVTGAAIKEQLGGYLDILASFDKSVVGGALPQDDFYDSTWESDGADTSGGIDAALMVIVGMAVLLGALVTVICLRRAKNKSRKTLTVLAVALFWLLLWEGLSHLIDKELILPTPERVFTVLIGLWQTATFWESVGFSLLRVLCGFVAAVIGGTVLAVLTERFAAARAILTPALQVVRAAPVASFILLAFFWIKVDILPAFIAMMMVLPLVWANVSEGIRQTDPGLLEMAQLYRLPRGRILREIRLPSLRPYFTAALTTGLGFAWKSGIAAEVICSNRQAIGASLREAKSLMEMPEVFAWTLTVVILSVVLEALLTHRIKGEATV